VLQPSTKRLGDRDTHAHGPACATYINANHIRGHGGAARYIAAQGPTPGTVHDFWRMVWEGDARAIVMMTGLVEGGVVKCER